MTVLRYWRGWTTPDNADAYQKVVTTIVIPAIEGRNIKGFTRIDLMRRELKNEVEFATIMHFNSLESIVEFMGKDYEISHVPDEAQAVLSRWDNRAVHYDIVQERLQSEA